MKRSFMLGCFAAALTAVLIAGCGGSSKSSSTGKGSATTTTTTTGGTGGTASTSLGTAAAAWGHAVASQNCQAIAATAFAASFPAARCQVLVKLAGKPTVGQTAVYGTGGVADVKLGNGKPGAAIFLLGASRGWRYLALVESGRAVVGTHPVDATGSASMITKVLGAIAAGSCQPVANDFPVFKTKTTRTAANCFGYSGTQFQKLLKQGIGTPKTMGGNARVSFYRVGIGTGEKHHFTVMLLTVKGAPKFFGAFPPPAAKKA